MVAKIAGLATGAFVASVGVWAFNEWRTVSDDDLLASALTDHCIPYVLTGAAPFDGVGRSAGVYDNVELDDRVSSGGARLVFDDRFAATWGDVMDPPLRICRLDGRALAGGTHAFAVDPDGFSARIAPMLAPLGEMRTDIERLGVGVDGSDLYQTLVWFEANLAEDKGNRVIFAIVDSQVSSVIVVNDLSD